jgi:hypothetical protein
MQTSNRAVRIQATKPRLSELRGGPSTFEGKTDFDVMQERRRKEHKPLRLPRETYRYEHEKTNVGADRKYLGEEL